MSLAKQVGEAVQAARQAKEPMADAVLAVTGGSYSLRGSWSMCSAAPRAALRAVS
jgi:hypothetical protein